MSIYDKMKMMDKNSVVFMSLCFCIWSSSLSQAWSQRKEYGFIGPRCLEIHVWKLPHFLCPFPKTSWYVYLWVDLLRNYDSKSLHDTQLALFSKVTLFHWFALSWNLPVLKYAWYIIVSSKLVSKFIAHYSKLLDSAIWCVRL